MKALRTITLTSLAFGSFVLAQGSGPRWSYEGGLGPAYWGELDVKYSDCLSGNEQSPVNLLNATKVKSSGLKFDYSPAKFEIEHSGHTLQMNFESGNTLTSGNKSYELSYLTYHTPSEHTIKGKSYPMELQFIHKAKNGARAIVSVLVEEGEEAQDGLEAIINFAPKYHDSRTIRGLRLDLTSLLPKKEGFYRYRGSITVPPCTEGVLWHVLKTPITAPKEQIQRFREFIGKNARPIQPLQNRVIELH